VNINVYGSSQTATALLKSKKLECTRQQLRLISKEFSVGAFAVVKDLKSFLIKYSDIKTPTFKMKIWDEEFEVEVNKHKVVGADLNIYTAYDSASDRNVTFANHSTIRIPDYDRFSLYFPTGLVHNLDSRVMDKSVDSIISNYFEWVIPIHDAALVMPGTAIREEFTTVMEDLRTNRHRILTDYRTSIGAVGKSADIAWAKLHSKVEPLCSAVPFSGAALK